MGVGECGVYDDLAFVLDIPPVTAQHDSDEVGLNTIILYLQNDKP